MKRADDIDDGDILTWEVQLRREGTLPPEVQGLLLEAVSDLLNQVAGWESAAWNHPDD